MNPVKPNFLACVVGLLLTAFMGMWLYNRVTKLLGELAGAATVGEAQQSAFSLVAHIVGGGSVLVPVVAGLVAWGIKLLDEQPEPGPTVPADVHRRIVELILADGRQTVAETEGLAATLEHGAGR